METGQSAPAISTSIYLLIKDMFLLHNNCYHRLLELWRFHIRNRRGSKGTFNFDTGSYIEKIL